ncbi:hypothetical protein [Microbacterium thalassium]|uniref:Uncharacterized protein n=1 Tax=Microbacterium thalassium TaxID=362649 RepID=A0A7X0FRA7_9MICO|nr:hypothetical protein [Microbacterium thalassium]MBB6392181.1 hypothetical protein [Microbacterium thalassium]GLK23392.1 hypothetical protein GCM10017607_07100 [Microbacterium thalassium]
MDAAKLTTAQTRELAELRVRAYGDSGAPALDPGEQARLAELEALARAPAGSPPADEPVDADPGDSARNVADSDGTPPKTAGGATEGAARPVDEPGPWWRRWMTAQTAAAVGIGVVIGLIAALALPSVTAPRADITLAETDEQWASQWESYLVSYDIVPESMQGHDRLDDVLMVWTADGIFNDRCLLIGHEPTMRITVETCTARDRYPSYDLIVTAQLRGVLDNAYPVGTTLRLVAREDAVDVHVLEPAGEGRVTGG